jgi:hypothetical protein
MDEARGGSIPQGIDHRDHVPEVALVVRDDGATPRVGYGGDDHVERAARPAGGRTLGHQPCSGEGRLLVER